MNRRSYTASFKLSVCRYAEEFGNRKAGRKYTISEANIRRWRAAKPSLETIPQQKKAMRGMTAKWPQMEEQLITWVREKRAEGHGISTIAVRLKASSIANQAGITNFKASMMWASRFMTRHNLPIQRRTRIAKHLPDNIANVEKSDDVKESDKDEAVNNSMASSPLTTHVLDTARGMPARNLNVKLFNFFGGQWKRIADGETNSDGRCPGLLTQDQFLPGVYKIHFDTGNYFKSSGTKGFYPFVDVVFEIEDPSQHYHVPLLLSPYSYSTYRGS